MRSSAPGWCAMTKPCVFWAVGIVVIVGAAVGAPAAQTPSDPTFEVASVKPATPELLQRRGFLCGFGAGGRFMGLGTLEWLIACAYNIPQARAGQRISGGPKWLNEDLFLIAATSPSAQIPNLRSNGLAMLRTLLTDRFKLVVHHETKEAPMWALVLARRDGRLGPQLRPTVADCAAWITGGRRGAPPPDTTDLPCGRGVVNGSAIRNSAITLARFADLLSPRVERPVQDRTGLTGDYYLDLQWRPDRPGPPDDGPSLDSLPTSVFTALQEQLGLKLESIKGSTDILVVDHAEHPAPN
jgi:uncharacterized protein (TIGR03435 family)